MLQKESGTNQTEGSVMDNKLNICVAWNSFFSNFVYKMKKKPSSDTSTVTQQ